MESNSIAHVTCLITSYFPVITLLLGLDSYSFVHFSGLNSCSTLIDMAETSVRSCAHYML